MGRDSAHEFGYAHQLGHCWYSPSAHSTHMRDVFSSRAAADPGMGQLWASLRGEEWVARTISRCHTCSSPLRHFDVAASNFPALQLRQSKATTCSSSSSSSLDQHQGHHRRHQRRHHHQDGGVGRNSLWPPNPSDGDRLWPYLQELEIYQYQNYLFESIGSSRRYLAQIQVQLVEGNNLIVCNMLGKSDPYALVRLGPVSMPEQYLFNQYCRCSRTMQSKVVPNSVNPIWAETFFFRFPLRWERTAQAQPYGGGDGEMHAMDASTQA